VSGLEIIANGIGAIVSGLQKLMQDSPELVDAAAVKKALASIDIARELLIREIDAAADKAAAQVDE